MIQEEQKLKPIKLTKRQIKWLDSMGGRKIDDVGENEIGKFTMMSYGYGKFVRIYLPK